jgi:hypothetical protein
MGYTSSWLIDYIRRQLADSSFELTENESLALLQYLDRHCFAFRDVSDMTASKCNHSFILKRCHPSNRS